MSIERLQTFPALLSVEDAARELGGVCPRHIFNLARRGELRLVQLGRRRLVPRAEIDRIVSGGLSTPTVRR